MAICDLNAHDQKKFISADNAPLILVSFGNVDLMSRIEKYMSNCHGELDKTKIEVEVKNRFFAVMTTLEIN